jgi:hypothetical protein
MATDARLQTRGSSFFQAIQCVELHLENATTSQQYAANADAKIEHSTESPLGRRRIGAAATNN